MALSKCKEFPALSQVQVQEVSVPCVIVVTGVEVKVTTLVDETTKVFVVVVVRSLVLVTMVVCGVVRVRVEVSVRVSKRTVVRVTQL